MPICKTKPCKDSPFSIFKPCLDSPFSIFFLKIAKKFNKCKKKKNLPNTSFQSCSICRQIKKQNIIIWGKKDETRKYIEIFCQKLKFLQENSIYEQMPLVCCL